MPRYFFDFNDGDRRTVDSSGLDLDNAEEVEREVMSALSQVLLYEASDGARRIIECHVRDDRQRIVYSAALDLKGNWVEGESQDGV